jgi:regulation of enolase protein 1 (concanavalin A-like superfamily)
MKLSLPFTLLALMVLAPLSVTNAQDINLTGYTQTFDDEFNSLSVTTSTPKGAATWYYVPPYGAAGNFSESIWDVNALSVSGGILSDKAYLDGSNNWHSGNISSVDTTAAGFSQLYGYFEIRCQQPNSGTGAWTSFWLDSTNGISGQQNEEVDIFEWYGTTNTPGSLQDYISQHSHNWNANGTENTTLPYLSQPLTNMPSGAYPWLAYHIYGCQIDPVHITWYVDGVQTNQITTPTAYLTSPFYIMSAYALGGGWPLTGMVNNSILGVDWIRVYALPTGGGSLPSPWTNQDVGSTGSAGNAGYTAGTGSFSVNGAGSGAYYTPDGFQYVSQTATGDCTVTARVATQANTAQYAKAGVMIRESTSATSAFAEMIVTPASGADFQYRATSGSPNSVAATGAAPAWVRVTRVGSTFTGYTSSDGTTWTQVGSTTLTMASSVTLGLTQASGNYGSLGNATFDNVSVNAGGGTAVANVQGNALTITSGDTTPITADGSDFGTVAAGTTKTDTFTVQNMGSASMTVGNVSISGTNAADFSVVTQPAATVTAGSSTTFSIKFTPGTAGLRAASLSFSTSDSAHNPYTFSIQGTATASGGSLPSPWLNVDVGSTGATGTATYSSGTFTVNGAGGGAYYTPDALQFVYQTVSGDCSITTKVVTQANTNIYAKAGVMIRETLATNSAFADMIITPTVGMDFQYRLSGASPNNVGATGAAPYWVRLTRAGNIFTAYSSPDGTTWTQVASTTVPMGASVDIGIAQSSGVVGTLGAATFSNVSLGTSGGGGLPSPWANQDVGSPGAAGSATYSGGTFTLNGAGGGAYYTPDALQFVYQAASGDCSVTARVVTQANTNQYAKTGVMIRETMATNSAFADMIITPTTTNFQWRPSGGNPSNTNSTGSVPYWTRITRVGNVFTAYTSTNGTTWTQIGTPQTLTMGTSVYIGLVQSSGVGTLGTATLDNVTSTP